MIDKVIPFSEMESLMPLIREILASGGSVRIMPHGVSMLPMIRQGIDSVVLSPLPEKLSKYDLPLYQRSNGKYVLHRIIKVGDTYTCMGDNQITPENGLRHDQMIAVVTAFYRGEKRHHINEPLYQSYCRIWLFVRQILRFFRRAIGWIARRLKIR